MKSTVYIFNSGVLKRENDTLLFEQEDPDTKEIIKRFIPVENVREIFIFGEVTLNKRLLEFLTQKEIMLSFFNYYDYYIGSYYPREHYNSGYMILKQAEHYMDTAKRLRLARKFVEGAAKNSLKVLKYYNRREKDLETVIDEIEAMVPLIQGENGIEGLMALEGKIKKSYYSAFNTIIVNPAFEFSGRSKRPPRDNINALISFSNSMIYTAVLSEIYRTHLDPRIGFLHTSNFRRFSLNLDAAEIFKVVIGDRCIFSLINKNIIQEDDFEKSLNGITLNDKGKRKFLEHLEERYKDTIMHYKLKKEVSYRRLIRMELYKIEKHLMGEENYEPFVMEW